MKKLMTTLSIALLGCTTLAFATPNSMLHVTHVKFTPYVPNTVSTDIYVIAGKTNKSNNCVLNGKLDLLAHTDLKNGSTVALPTDWLNTHIGKGYNCAQEVYYPGPYQVVKSEVYQLLSDDSGYTGANPSLSEITITDKTR